MNKNSGDREKLLAELFHGEWPDGPAAQFARRAAALARRRRRYRHAFIITGAAAGIIAVWAISLRHLPSPSPRTPVVASPAPAYEIISDDEFLAQLKDRPLLVTRGKNGAREFVVLDR